MNEGWIDIQKEPPPPNEEVFILGSEGLDIRRATFSTIGIGPTIHGYEKQNLKNGSHYWITYTDGAKSWTTFEEFPYWITKINLAELSTAFLPKRITEHKEKPSRFSLLDIKEEKEKL
jgi:hypothetical protein